MNTNSPLRLLAIAGLSLTTITLLTGCSDADTNADASSSQAEDHSGHDHGADDHGHDHADDSDSVAPTASLDVYENILGEIKLLPIEGDPTTALKIRHQQIPNFKLKDGTINTNSKGISGMMSMTMPFPLADGVSIDTLTIGDKVQFTFAVDWSGQGTAWEVTKIEKIDANTVIDYTNTIEELKDAAKEAVDSAIDDAKETLKEKMPDMPKLPGNDGP